MSLQSCTFRASPEIVTANTLLADLRTGPTDYPRVQEIIVVQSNWTGNIFGLALGLSASVGVARVNGIVFLGEDGGSDPGGLSIGLDWTVRPTIPTSFFRRVVNSAAAAMVMQASFRFTRGLKLAPNSSLSIWVTNNNAVAGIPVTASDITITVDV